MSTPELLNLTPHALRFYARCAPGEEPALALAVPSSGSLRIASAPMLRLAPIVCDGAEGGVSVPVLAAQAYTGIDETTDGWRAWVANPDAHVVVSLPAAQYICQPGNGGLIGRRHVYCPATDPANAVRDASGALLGAYALVRYT